MRPWMLAALSMTMASLGLGTYLAAIDVAESTVNRTQQSLGDWRANAFAARDELGRPACRRNNFADPQRPILRIGQNCQ